MGSSPAASVCCFLPFRLQLHPLVQGFPWAWPPGLTCLELYSGRRCAGESLVSSPLDCPVWCCDLRHIPHPVGPDVLICKVEWWGHSWWLNELVHRKHSVWCCHVNTDVATARQVLGPVCGHLMCFHTLRKWDHTEVAGHVWLSLNIMWDSSMF